jgi:hypothetical protein
MAVKFTKIDRVKAWYEMNERRISTFSLLFGFVFDSLTLQRIDALRENLWMLFNLVLVASCIIILNRQESDASNDLGEVKKHFWLMNFLQFGFGALLGTFFIFYFRSATLAAAWPFLAVILGAMVANELFQKKYARLTLQISFLYLSLFSFAIFLVPLAVKKIGPGIFLLSGVVSLIVISIFILVLKYFAYESFKKSQKMLLRSIGGIFIAINILYFANIIPPVPLSLKDAGMYHSISRISNISYKLEGERKGLLQFFHLKETVHLEPGAPAFAYSAIFSPTDFNIRIVHEWQYKKEKGDWVTASRIPLFVSGGREGGFRTYSMKSNLSPGVWRVNVSTERGQLIGRINFQVRHADTRPRLITYIKE